jgi:hypothetical protein
MLRIKKYSKINKNSMIRFLKSFKYEESDDFDTCNKIDNLKYSICYFYLYLKKYIRTTIIKKYKINDNINDNINYNINDNINYQIVKDSFTETWFFTCDKLVILYIRKNDIQDFYNTWNSSRLYKFVIYKDLKYYVVFCISHTSDQIHDYLRFLVDNNHEAKYLIFSCFLLNNKTNESFDLEFINYNQTVILKKSTPIGFIILNTHCKVCNPNIKPKRMQFYTTLGGGETNYTIVHLVEISLKIIKESQNLPVNYFI